MNTPFARDTAKEIADAFRAEGIAVGWYFSPDDFHFLYRQGTLVSRLRAEALPPKNPGLLALNLAQERELMTNYGRIDIVFFDPPTNAALERDTIVHEMKRQIWEISPETVITRGEIETPEQYTPGVPLEGAWEGNMTMGTQWQYRGTNEHYKSGRELIGAWIETRAKGGNFLLNIGPMPSGRLPVEQEARMREMALWHMVNAEAVGAVRPWVITNEGDIWLTKAKHADTVYAFVPGRWGGARRRPLCSSPSRRGRAPPCVSSGRTSRCSNTVRTSRPERSGSKPPRGCESARTVPSGCTTTGTGRIPSCCGSGVRSPDWNRPRSRPYRMPSGVQGGRPWRASYGRSGTRRVCASDSSTAARRVLPRCTSLTIRGSKLARNSPECQPPGRSRRRCHGWTRGATGSIARLSCTPKCGCTARLRSCRRGDMTQWAECTWISPRCRTAAALLACVALVPASGEVLRMPIGVTPAGSPIRAIVTSGALDPEGPTPRILLIGGLDGSEDSVDLAAALMRNPGDSGFLLSAVLNAFPDRDPVEVFPTPEARPIRGRGPGRPITLAIPRGMLAPDLVVGCGCRSTSGELEAALQGASPADVGSLSPLLLLRLRAEGEELDDPRKRRLERTVRNWAEGSSPRRPAGPCRTGSPDRRSRRRDQLEVSGTEHALLGTVPSTSRPWPW